MSTCFNNFSLDKITKVRKGPFLLGFDALIHFLMSYNILYRGVYKTASKFDIMLSMALLQMNIDVIVVGGGHAGTEAALAAARMGVQTLLITSQIDAIARMPCNPSIGGLAKSHLVYELDALGGEMGRNADATALQSKILNRSRGPAVWATRCQCAKAEYAARMQAVVRSQPNLTVLEDAVIGLGGYKGLEEGLEVQTERNGFFTAKAVVITSGTTLRGRIWIGKECEESGGDGRPAVNQLSECLEKLGFENV